MIELIHADGTSKGMVRQNNEDAFGRSPKDDFFFVCDGMGGHAAGDLASNTTVRSITENISSSTPEKQELITIIRRLNPSLPDILIEPAASIFLANRRLFQLAVQHPVLRGMGTTLVSCVFNDNGVHTLHVGDSRAYLFRSGTLRQLTRDHSWVNELLEDNEISADEARTFKKKNIVTRVLGTQPVNKIDINRFALQQDDIFLLCSDGLTGPVPDDLISSILTRYTSDLPGGVAALIDAANKAGGPDNITTTLIKVSRCSPGSSLIEELPKPITITDDHDNQLTIEDRLIKKLFARQKLRIPPEPPAPKKSLKQRLPALLIIGILLAIFAFSAVTLFKNYDEKLHPEKYTLIASENYDPTSLTGNLEIITDPAHAEIYIDGSTTPSGISPLIIPFKNLDPEGNNTHFIRVKKYGYREIETSKEIIANDSLTLTLSLQPEALLELYLGIETQFPEESVVSILPLDTRSGERELTTIGMIQNVAYQEGIPAGKYKLTIQHNKHTLWNYTFNAVKGKKTKIYINKEMGSESIQHEHF